MAKLQFSVILPSRVGAAPPSNHWAFHHVLPWRYYWMTGYLLTMLAKYRIHSTQWASLEGHQLQEPLDAEANLMRAAKPARGGKKAAKTPELKDLYGTDHKNFACEDEPTELLRLCEGMHGAGVGAANAVNAQVVQDGKLVAANISGLCTNPRWGGFEGMNGSEQRLDDPHSECEGRRPYSGAGEWWTSLTNLKHCLERCAPKLTAVPDDRKLQVTLSEADRRILVHEVRKLDHDYNAVLAFNPSDWNYMVNNEKINWLFVTGTGAVALKSEIAKVFALNADGNGGGTAVHNTPAALAQGLPYKVRRGVNGNAQQKMYFY